MDLRERGSFEPSCTKSITGTSLFIPEPKDKSCHPSTEQHAGQTLLLLFRKKSIMFKITAVYLGGSAGRRKTRSLQLLVTCPQQLMGPLSWQRADSRRPRDHAGVVQDPGRFRPSQKAAAAGLVVQSTSQPARGPAKGRSALSFKGEPRRL